MKVVSLSLFFVFLSYTSVAQLDTVPLIKAQSLAGNEALVREMVSNEVHVHYYDESFPIDTSEINALYRFFDNPFSLTSSTDLRPFSAFYAFVKENARKKMDVVEEGDYDALKNCFSGLPSDFSTFLEDDKVMFREEMKICVLLDREKDFIRRVINEGIMEAYFEGGMLSPRERRRILSAFDILQNNGTEEDSSRMDNLAETLENLKGKISTMRDRKKSIASELYPKLRTCNGTFPRSYQEFVEEDRHILTETTESCFFRLISQDEEDILIQDWEIIMMRPDERGKTRPLPKTPLPVTPTDADLESMDLPENGVNLAALSPTTLIIDATAQFLVERTREELMLAFFDQFQQRIDSIIELRFLFDNTYSLLKNRDILKIPSLGEAWQKAFEMDLRLLPASFDRMVNETAQYSVLRDNVGYKLFRLTNSFINKDSVTLASSLKRLTKRSLGDCENLLDTSFFATYLLLPYVSDGQGGNYLEVRDQMEDLTDRERLFFVALQYQESAFLLDQIQSRDGDMSLGDWMKESTQLFFNKELTLAGLLSNVDREITGFEFPKRPEITKDNAGYYQQLLKDYLDELPNALAALGNISKQTVRSAFLFQYFQDETSIYRDEDYRRLMGIIQASTDLLGAVESREPSRILVSSLRALDPFFLVLKNRQVNRIHALEGEVKAANNAQKDLLKSQIDKEIKRMDQLKVVSEHMSFYGGFFLDILGAESSKEIKAALYRYAVPAGSYRLKRESLFSLEIGAYPGFYTGAEWVFDEQWQSPSVVSGFTAPIGVSLSWGKRSLSELDDQDAYKYIFKGDEVKSRRLAGWSVGIFVPVIDIIAPFSYRWTNGFDEGLPESIRWQQILAPGAYLVWGIKGVPASLSIGGQYVPRLRSITVSGNVVSNVDAVRLGANLSLDLPIFSIYRK